MYNQRLTELEKLNLKVIASQLGGLDIKEFKRLGYNPNGYILGDWAIIYTKEYSPPGVVYVSSFLTMNEYFFENTRSWSYELVLSSGYYNRRKFRQLIKIDNDNLSFVNEDHGPSNDYYHEPIIFYSLIKLESCKLLNKFKKLRYINKIVNNPNYPIPEFSN